MQQNLSDKQKTELDKLANLKRQIIKQREIVINEVLQLLSATEPSLKAQSIRGFSFIQTFQFRGLSQWNYRYLSSDEAIDNIKLLLERSTDLQLTLSRIVQHKNMPRLIKTEGYPFFLKVKKEWIEAIKSYLGDKLIVDDREKKRNIHPKNK